MYRIDLSQIALFLLFASLAWFGAVPWWVLPALILNNTPLLLTYRTKAYREQAARELAEWEKFAAELQNRLAIDKPLDGKWN